MSAWLIGIFSALAAATCWAIATIWFKQLTQYFSFLSLNFYKGIITLCCVVVCLPFLNVTPEHWQTSAILLILLSGVIGIGIGDSALFAALQRLSERQTLLIAECVAPIFVIFGAMIWLDEYLTVSQWLAIIMIVVSVEFVLGLRASRKSKDKGIFIGFLFAIIAAICQAIGVLMIREVYLEQQLSPLLATGLRVLGGISFIILIIRFDFRKLKPIKPMSVSLYKRLFLASFVGTFLALLLVQVALMNAPAAIVQTLIAMSAIISTLIAIHQGDHVNKKVWIGLVLSWLGVVIMAFSSVTID